MFTEDLSQFFDTTNGFAVDATIKTAAGVTVRSVKVIFDTPLDAMQMFDASVEKATPSALCRTSDLAGVTHDHKMQINAVSYRIVKHTDDGTGISTVELRV